MALSNDRRQQLRIYLGYASVALQVNRILENAMDAVDAKETDGHPEVRVMIEAELDEVLRLEGEMRTANSKARFKRIEDIEFNVPGAALVALRQQALFHVQRLGTLLSCPVLQNPFSFGPVGGQMRQG